MKFKKEEISMQKQIYHINRRVSNIVIQINWNAADW